MTQTIPPICPYCQKPSEKVTGKRVYPWRKDLHHKTFYICAADDARVGCHPGGDKPLGRLANAELRALKMQVHAAFDPIWKEGYMKRGAAYDWLAAQMGLHKNETHVGMFSEDRARIALKVCQEFWDTLHGLSKPTIHNPPEAMP